MVGRWSRIILDKGEEVRIEMGQECGSKTQVRGTNVKISCTFSQTLRNDLQLDFIHSEDDIGKLLYLCLPYWYGLPIQPLGTYFDNKTSLIDFLGRRCEFVSCKLASKEPIFSHFSPPYSYGLGYHKKQDEFLSDIDDNRAKYPFFPTYMYRLQH